MRLLHSLTQSILVCLTRHLVLPYVSHRYLPYVFMFVFFGCFSNQVINLCPFVHPAYLVCQSLLVSACLLAVLMLNLIDFLFRFFLTQETSLQGEIRVYMGKPPVFPYSGNIAEL